MCSILMLIFKVIGYPGIIERMNLDLIREATQEL